MGKNKKKNSGEKNRGDGSQQQQQQQQQPPQQRQPQPRQEVRPPGPDEFPGLGGPPRGAEGMPSQGGPPRQQQASQKKKNKGPKAATQQQSPSQQPQKQPHQQQQQPQKQPHQQQQQPQKQPHQQQQQPQKQPHQQQQPQKQPHQQQQQPQKQPHQQQQQPQKQPHQQQQKGPSQQPQSQQPSPQGSDSGKGKDGGENNNKKQPDIVTKFSSLSVGNTKSQYQIPHAKSLQEKMGKLGTLGRKIKVRANHYELKLKVPEVHQYQVSYTLPWKRDLKKTDAPLLFRVIEKMKKNLKVSPASIVFDGQYSMYSIHKLPDNFTSKISVREILENEKEVEIGVTFKHVDSIDISDSLKDYLSPTSSRSKCEIIAKSAQVLNVILGMSGQLQFTTIGRSVYSPETKGCVHDIEGSGKSLWQGTFLSVRFAWKPFLNVDMANKPGYLQSSIEEFASKCCVFRDRRPRADDVFRDYRSLATLEAELKGLKIRFNRPDNNVRDYRFNKFVKSAIEEKVEVDGKKIKIVDYYFAQYKYRLKYPHWPCMHVGNPNATIYLPPELCMLKTQACPNSKKLSDIETANMIRKTAIPPSDRRKILTSNLRSINDFFSKDKYANEFGITVSKDMTLLNARVLEAPKLEYKGGRTVAPRDGKWNTPNMAFLTGKSLTNWAVLDTVNLRPSDNDNFVNALYEHGRTCGLEVDFPLKFQANGRDLKDAVFQFKNAHKALKANGVPQLIMIFMENRGPMYPAIKHVGDVELGIPTQFILKKNVLPHFKTRQISPQTIHNICLKLNSKLGGTNQILPKSVRPALMNRPNMVVGADVTHPSPDQKDKPSIAAVVASCDPNASIYNVQVRVQVSRKNNAVCEVILEMESVMKELLMEFYRKTNSHKPEKIIFYRDGVSEGQFQEVLDKEMSAIRRACLSISPDYKPGITFLVAQKRHKTRLFPENPNDGVGKMRNIPPGTVVDSDICHPTEYDFFLASHEGIQGTTKPTHYHLLWDDNNLSMDNLQTLTYYLCHLYSRCERSVSYPAPTYYAHLAAFRARHHHNRLIDMKMGENPTKLQEIQRMQLTNYFV